MKITVEPTPQFFMAGEVMVRAWKGHDAEGNQVVALISAVRVSADTSAYDGLVSIPPPDGETARAWAAEVLSRRYEDDPRYMLALWIQQAIDGLAADAHT
jgi:hypothetical protein